MRVGNTPTCVGKTRPAFVVTVRNWKHPHMRGEDGNGSYLRNSDIETPPHAWGRRNTLTEQGVYAGNTPTCVGKTLALSLLPDLDRKHPHMRGEDLSALTLIAPSCGNTPTCVGKTDLANSKQANLGKHPHMRGED